MTAQTVNHADFIQWLQPFMEHIGLSAHHVKRIAIECVPDGVDIRYTLIDTADPSSENPAGHLARAANRGIADESTLALYEVVVPVRSLAVEAVA